MEQVEPETLARVTGLLADLGGRFMCWTGFRGKEAQEDAFRRGKSRAHWLQSPHNYVPAFAVDVALNPGLVDVLPHPDDPRYPWLWDNESPEAVAAWRDLERAAVRHHLEQVDVHGKRDLPHLQLPGWRAMADRGRRVR